MAFSLTWLPKVLLNAGLKVAEQSGWRGRGRGDVGPIKGVICHHTAGPLNGNMPSLDFHGTEFASHHVHAKTHFSAISCAIRYQKWCSDSMIARRLFAPHRYDCPIIRTPAGRMMPRRVVYQSTIFANGKRQIPESYESLGDSNVSGISFRGVGAKKTESNESLESIGR